MPRMLFHFTAINYIILKITSSRAYCITALTHPRVYVSITMTALVILCWGWWDGCSIWWYRRCSAAGVEFANQSRVLTVEGSMAHCTGFPCALKEFNACGCHVQHPHGRTPEKLLQMLAPPKCQIIDQICFEVKCLCHSPGKNKLTLQQQLRAQDRDWVCSYMFAFPASTQNLAAAPGWATRNKTFTCPKGKTLSVRPQCQALMTYPLYILLAHHSFVVFTEKGEGSLEQKSCRV